MARPPIVWPTGIGFAALADVGRVPWRDLAFAYHYREHPGLAHDIEATLRAFADADWSGALDECYSNIIHQQTVYEATAYAVPFLVSLAAGPDLPLQLRVGLVLLLVSIALSASFDTEDGGSAGAFGEGAGELIREVLVTAKPRLAAVAALDPARADVVTAILAIASEPTKAAFEALLELSHRTDAELEVLDDNHDIDDRPAAAVPTTRYRHAKLGDATLVRTQENGLRLRFDDGTERVIQARFVTIID
jgi:hypothetical protein